MPILDPFMTIYDIKNYKYGIDLSKIREIESDPFNGHNIKFSDGKVIHIDSLTLIEVQNEWEKWRKGKRFKSIDCRDKEGSNLISIELKTSKDYSEMFTTMQNTRLALKYGDFAWAEELAKRAISYIPTIKNVEFNPPLTVVIWGDDTKTFVKCSEDETYDPEKGLAMAIAKKALGNKYNAPRVIDEWVDKKWEKANK